MQQHRFCLVVPGMAESDPGRAAATGQAAQAGAADASCELFRGRAARPGRRRAGAQAEKRQTQRLRQVPHPGGVATGALAERVIDVTHHDPPAAGGRFRQAKTEQPRGIGTAGDPDQESRAIPDSRSPDGATETRAHLELDAVQNSLGMGKDTPRDPAAGGKKGVAAHGFEPRTQ